MSDPTAELQAGADALLRADAGVKALFAGGRVKVFDIVPTNQAEPYIVLGEDLVLPAVAECLDGAETEATLHVWSRTDPPGKLEAKAIGAAIQAAFCPVDANGVRGLPDLGLTTQRLVATRLVRAHYLTDPVKPETAHGVIVIGLSTEAT